MKRPPTGELFACHSRGSPLVRSARPHHQLVGPDGPEIYPVGQVARSAYRRHAVRIPGSCWGAGEYAKKTPGGDEGLGFFTDTGGLRGATSQFDTCSASSHLSAERIPNLLRGSQLGNNGLD
jgi:hypothetical protein